MPTVDAIYSISMYLFVIPVSSTLKPILKQKADRAVSQCNPLATLYVGNLVVRRRQFWVGEGTARETRPFSTTLPAQGIPPVLAHRLIMKEGQEVRIIAQTEGRSSTR